MLEPLVEPLEGDLAAETRAGKSNLGAPLSSVEVHCFEHLNHTRT